MLTSQEESTLLAVARDTLEQFVANQPPPEVEHLANTPMLRQDRATFVTLREQNGDLRGCIGSTTHTAPLIVSVRDNTIRSAGHDPRFEAVAPNELDGLEIEVSALMDGDDPGLPFRRVAALDEIVIGRDGLYLERGGQGAGLLLPQVASERNWDVSQFLDALCRKSGLAPDAWQTPDAALFRFGAHIFAEPKSG